MTCWRLKPLLDLRRREEDRATGDLGRAMARWRAAGAEAAAVTGQATEAARLALEPLPPRGAGPVVGAAGLLAWAGCAARRRREAARLDALAAEAEARCRVAAAAVEAGRGELRRAAQAREVVERLEAGWRRAQAAGAARRAEAALDDRRWPPRPISASRPGGSRPGPGRTGW